MSTTPRPTTSTPATLFVPMFAPDEVGGERRQRLVSLYRHGSTPTIGTTCSTIGTTLAKQSYMPKYFDIATTAMSAVRNGPGRHGRGPEPGLHDDADHAAEGRERRRDQAGHQRPRSTTCSRPATPTCPRAWPGAGACFRTPRRSPTAAPKSEKGNDKVVIVLTDGANTYSTPVHDGANNKSTYAALGYAGQSIFRPAIRSRASSRARRSSNTDYSSSNYTAAMDQQFAKLCDNAKAANLMVITVSLDLRTTNAAEKKAIDALTACASTSRFTKDGRRQAQEALFRRHRRHAQGQNSRRSRTSFRTCASSADRAAISHERPAHGGPFRFQGHRRDHSQPRRLK